MVDCEEVRVERVVGLVAKVVRHNVECFEELIKYSLIELHEGR